MNYLVIGVAKGARGPPIKIPPMIKIITAEHYVFAVSVSCSIFAYNSIRELQRPAIISIGDQVAWGPLKSKFSIKFKCTVKCGRNSELLSSKLQPHALI